LLVVFEALTVKVRCKHSAPIAMPTAIEPEYRSWPEPIAEIGLHVDQLFRAGGTHRPHQGRVETTMDRPKNGMLISKMRPCRLIQLFIALRRNTANPTPCTSLGKRTGGGSNLFRAGVSQGSAWPARSCGASNCEVSDVQGNRRAHEL